MNLRFAPGMGSKSIVLLSRNTVSATLSKTCLSNHPPLLFELVFDEGQRIATAASIPDISSGDRHRGALHSVGTGSKSIVLLSRNSLFTQEDEWICTGPDCRKCGKPA